MFAGNDVMVRAVNRDKIRVSSFFFIMNDYP